MSGNRSSCAAGSPPDHAFRSNVISSAPSVIAPIVNRRGCYQTPHRNAPYRPEIVTIAIPSKSLPSLGTIRPGFDMDAERWGRIAQIYELACERPLAVQASFLLKACGGDEELRREVLSLLRQGVSQDGPLERVAAHVRTALSAPAFIGKYRIVRLIGEGGMGAVYEAEQDRPHRAVALKVLKSALASAELLRRFTREAEVLGRLQHPNIARIYEADSASTDLGPQPYFAMEFIRGVSLLEYAKQNRLGIPQRVQLMIKVCEAVNYAHQCGVIHRDLK